MATSYGDIAKEFGLTPQTKAVMTKEQKGSLFIGIPRETTFQEKRVALTPDSVELLVNRGHQIRVESNAGAASKFTDREYSEAGAEIVFDKKQVYEANIVLKVAPPAEDEIDLLKFGQIIFSPVHLPTLNKEYIQKLMSKKVTSIAYEYLQDESGAYPIVRTVSEIVGSTAVLIAAEYLSNANKGQGVIFGGVLGIPPTRVVVLGAGTVGEYVTRAAFGLGANVKVFDNNIYKLSRLQNNVGQRVFTSVTNPTTLADELSRADVAVGAMHSKTGRTPVIVTEAMVANMKPGAVIVDVSIDQGGCFETSEMTTHDKPTFVKHDVVHYCVPNISSRVSKTASYALSNILTPVLLKVQEHGGFEKFLVNSAGTRNGVYLYKGSMCNQNMGRAFDLKYTNLDLIMSTRSFGS